MLRLCCNLFFCNSSGQAYAAPVNGGRTSPVAISIVKGVKQDCGVVEVKHGVLLRLKWGTGCQFGSNDTYYIIYYTLLYIACKNLEPTQKHRQKQTARDGTFCRCKRFDSR